MKLSFLLLTMFMSSQVFAVSTKNCPSELNLEFRNFRGSAQITPNKDNPGLPFAYIAVQEENLYFSDTLKLVETEKATCGYRGSKISYAKIEGSLKKNAKKPAVIKSFFSFNYKGLKLGYVAYSPIKSISKDKTVTLKKSRSDLYYSGQHCDHGECVSDYFKVGNTVTTLTYDQNISCFGVKKARGLLSKYLKMWNGSEYIPEEDAREDIFSYDLNSKNGISKYVKTLVWTGTHYSSNSYYNYECAPSADCWGGFNVTCDGEITEWQDGEE